MKRAGAHANLVVSRNSRFAALILMALGGALSACQGSAGKPVSLDLTPEKHTGFPITSGTAHELHRAIGEGMIQCESCHPSGAKSFDQIKCGGCHG
ncbi:MAG TPA: hypothetical protein VMU34_12725, partial [Mycobacterium sp.]|nr:hypothetical protein [Mycobacterium sp.]